MQIRRGDLIDALLTLNDALTQAWIVDLGASFHVTPIRSVLLPFMQATMDMYTLEVTMDMYAFSIEGIGVVHLTVDGTNELVLHDVRYVPSIKKKLIIFWTNGYAWI